MSASYHRRSLYVLLCFVFLFGIANCETVYCSYNGCQSSRYWLPSYIGNQVTYSTSLTAGYEMDLDVYFEPNEQNIGIYITSSVLAPATVKVLWNGDSSNVAVAQNSGVILSTTLNLPQSSTYNYRYLRFVISNPAFVLTSNIDVTLTVSYYNYSYIYSSLSDAVTKVSTYIIIIIAAVAAVGILTTIAAVICCIKRRRRMMSARRLQTEKAALEPISSTSNYNNSQLQPLQNTSSPYQQQPQQMMYMQNQYPQQMAYDPYAQQQPQMIAYDPYAQQQAQAYMPVYAQSQVQPQMPMMYQGSPQGY